MNIVSEATSNKGFKDLPPLLGCAHGHISSKYHW